jgi:transcriptional regulator with XRE-family HTH domain
MFKTSLAESILITASQLRAARALLGMDQRSLAQAAKLSLPTIQRMEASEGMIRGTVDSLMKLVVALKTVGIELIDEGGKSLAGGRGVRLREARGDKGRRITPRAQPQTQRRLASIPRRSNRPT